MAAVSFFNRRRLMRETAKVVSDARKEADSIVKEARVEAESIKKDKILQAKEKFIELKAEHEKIINQKNRKIAEAEQRTTQGSPPVPNDRGTEEERTATGLQTGGQ